MSPPGWLSVRRGAAPLIVSIPHAGTAIPPHLKGRFVSHWLARRDADWWVDELYAFAADLGATVIATALSRSVIDVNRDPSGASLYPGRATTELCPTTTFDGQALYRKGHAPDAAEIAVRRRLFFEPYHQALAEEAAWTRDRHGAVVVYDAHSIRSRAPRLFDGELPHFNIGTNDGASCAPELTAAVEVACASSNLSRVTNGRFKGGFITRYHAAPETGVHAVQMELACRGYMGEPDGDPAEDTWPPPFDADRAAPMVSVLRNVLSACLEFARSR
ncbi:MAG TPA: N-formylglutamate deformylase [Caulobacteraceae bacterium]|nr:N-formylglutamate deformylase [Caulobacteraceae bacterium]